MTAAFGTIRSDGVETASALNRLGRAAAMTSFVGILVVVGSTLLVWGGRGFPDQPMSFFRGPIGFIEIGILAAVFGGIGAFLAGRLPGMAIGWSLIIIGIGVALHMPVSVMVGQALQSFRPIPPMLLNSAWLLTSGFVPLAVTLMAYVLLILPDGRLPSRRWALPLAVLLTGFVVLTVASALEPSGLLWFPTLPNPMAVSLSAAQAVALARLVGVGLLVIGLELAASAMLARYRRGDTATRRQLRWIAGGAFVWAVTLAPFLIVRYLAGAPEAVASLVVLIAVTGTLAIPISIFFATMRDHLFGIHAIVGRTLVYLPVMAIVAGTYAAGLLLAQRLFVALTGNTSDVAIILATLLMTAAITPVKRVLDLAAERLKRGSEHPDQQLDDAGVQASRYRELTRQAQGLAATLRDVERQLASLTAALPNDPTVEMGEPGVGRAHRA
jgi:hypothetical protein